MTDNQIFIAIRRDRFYGNEHGGRRHSGGLPHLVPHDDDAPIWDPPADMQGLKGIPIEYFLFPVISQGDWNGCEAQIQIIDDAGKKESQATGRPVNLNFGSKHTTMYLPKMHPNINIDNVSTLQVNAKNYGIIQKHEGRHIVEVDSLDALFQAYHYHLPDITPDIDVPEAVQEMLSKVPAGPLNGILVVAFDQQIAGALASEELARSGALVIKVEKEKEGDPKRNNSSKTSFGTFNAGKFSVTFDETAQSQKLKRDILACADVIIDNRSIAAQRRDRILQESLSTEKRDNPVIFTSISGFGRDTKRPAYDRVLQAESGMAELNGKIIPFPLVDMATGKEAASEITKMLFLRERMTPRKRAHTPTIRIDISMISVALNMMANQVTTFIDTGKTQSTIVPFDLYDTKDGKISIAVAKDDQFLRLAEILGVPELREYDTNDKRYANRKMVESTIKKALLLKNSDDWIALLDANNIPVGPVYNLEQALENHGHTILKATAQGTLFVGSPTVSSLFPSNPRIDDAPAHGQHTDLARHLAAHFNGHATAANVLSDSLTASIKKSSNAFRRQYEYVDIHDIDFSGSRSNVIWAKGKFFSIKKTGTVSARQAKPYEVIDVVHTDEETKFHTVTKQVAMPHDWIITNSYGDTYILPNTTFRKHYISNGNISNSYIPNPELPFRKAVEVTQNVCFMSPSHNISYIPKGGWIVEGRKSNYGVHPNNITGNYKTSSTVSMATAHTLQRE